MPASDIPILAGWPGLLRNWWCRRNRNHRSVQAIESLAHTSVPFAGRIGLPTRRYVQTLPKSFAAVP